MHNLGEVKQNRAEKKCRKVVPWTCPWSLVPGPRSLVPGPWSLVPGPWSLVPGPWSLVFGRWSLVPGPWSLVPGPWSLVPGARSLVPGPWSLVPGPGPGPGPLAFRDPDMISGMSEPDPDAGQTGSGCQNLAFQRFEPIIILDFSWRFRKKALEKHISRQMSVYEQITFFHKKSKFFKIFFPDRKIVFLRGVFCGHETET